MAITAQDLDRRITIQRAVSAGANALNEQAAIWENYAIIWARRRDVSDGERDAAGQRGGFLMSRFVVRSTSSTRDLRMIDRIVAEGLPWNIHGIKEADEGRNRFIEITAVRKVD